MPKQLYLTPAQVKSETERCLNCQDKPCMKACPANCSPADFISLLKSGDENAYIKAAKNILNANPFGQTCGLTCPDQFCMAACSRRKLDMPVKINALQATILEKVRKTNAQIKLKPVCLNGKNIAIIGAGPAGLSAASVLARKGYSITVFEGSDRIGGTANLIPEFRLPHDVIEADWNFIKKLGQIELKLNTKVINPVDLLKDGYDGIIVAIGEGNSIKMGIPGEDLAISFKEYLKNPEKYKTSGNVAILGGGAVATDCATTAKRLGATNVEMFVRRRICDMRLTNEERLSLLDEQIDITSMTRITAIKKKKKTFILQTCKTRFNGTKLEDIPRTKIKRPDFDLVVMAVGSKADPMKRVEKVLYAGDCNHGGSTIVECVASGKNAANELHATLSGEVDESVCPVSKVVSYKAKSCQAINAFNQ
ncbi:MAG: FAD-dependent oxidoreductase [Alphaproteobacteria bacterium]|nr:FAD-dependent oxidoreductase [Alphaproteobacteria bacterium]